MDSPTVRRAFTKVRHYYRTSYTPDWIALLLLLLSNIIFLRHDPFYRQFSLSDLRISHPFAIHERVPVSALLWYGAFTPLATVTIISLLYPTQARRASSPLGSPGGTKGVSKYHKLHLSLLSVVTSVVITTVLTDLVKNAVGRPRPDLLDRCKPDLDRLQEGIHILDSIVGKGKLVGVEICTQTNKHLLQEGWRSFPSGHSSLSFAGLGWLSLWLGGQLGAGRRGSGLVGVVVCALPWVGALSIAISRTADYRHDVWDVTAGSVMGFIIAYYSYRRFFPPLTAPGCHEPYLTRMSDDLELEIYDGRGKFQRLEGPLGETGPAPEGSGSGSGRGRGEEWDGRGEFGVDLGRREGDLELGIGR
ncbi:acid phosphatase/Vanadium-dependent haloperoxidase [Ascobolus immersus RN42]|uniref:Acid phosphatase/Vanadium-dependent haloperoxidase n=1 Tax=Ascobolus immersus RN42 TaxID=1160509 RepID=A0A3N4HJT8_ASCIM|nr:acid phosphatase/Vanadium-dependent haloperoxidase [Ascobolus immersus RN42]